MSIKKDGLLLISSKLSLPIEIFIGKEDLWFVTKEVEELWRYFRLSLLKGLYSLSGAVSKIRSQGICGSCYAYAVTSAIESAYYLKVCYKFF